MPYLSHYLQATTLPTRPLILHLELNKSLFPQISINEKYYNGIGYERLPLGYRTYNNWGVIWTGGFDIHDLGVTS